MDKTSDQYKALITWIELNKNEDEIPYWSEKDYDVKNPGISYNYWHSQLLKSFMNPFDTSNFFRFTYLLNSASGVVEIPNGIPINDPIIVDQPTYSTEFGNNPPKYVSAWQFIYPREILEEAQATL